MTNIIKVKFLRDGQPSGRDYTYYTPEAVEVGDTVDIETERGTSKGIVTATDVPEAEIAPFKDRAKTIIGKTKIVKCELCAHLTPQGDGVYTCSESPDERKVIADFKETADALWCGGKNYKEA